MSQPQTLRLDFGEHAVFRLAITKEIDDTPLPLAGLALYFAIRGVPGGLVLLLKSTASGIAVVGSGDDGEADLTLLTADTEDWYVDDDGVAVKTVRGIATKSYWWDVWTFDGAGEKQPLCGPSPIVFTRGVVHP